jgi:ribosome-binding protein aMBF1 (putative translation factor)
MYVRDLTYWKKRLGDDYEFDDLLWVAAAEKKTSLKALSKELEVSNTYLNQIANRKLVFNETIAKKFVQKLDYDYDVASYAMMNYYNRVFKNLNKS